MHTTSLSCVILLQEVGVNGAREASYRFFFDITFFIIITTIGLNIVFGIIIDTFSELREARVSQKGLLQEADDTVFFLLQFSAEQDMKSTCFICSLPSHKFDSRVKDVSCLAVGIELEE